MDNADKESSININKTVLKQQMRHKEIELLKIRIEMLKIKNDIAKTNIDLIQNEKKILFLENSDKNFLQNEYSDFNIIDKSVNSNKHMDEKVAEFALLKDTNLKFTNSQISGNKMSNPLVNNTIHEDKSVHKKINEEETEEMLLKNKCIMDNNDDFSQLILTLENKIQQIVEKFENVCEQLHLIFDSN